MNVFISWSGDRSLAVAKALRDWLPKVIQATKPWLSAKDTDKGTLWRKGLAERLRDTNAGIICLTKNNQHSPWLLFEAGALSKSVDESFVCPYLFGISSGDVKGPLADLQHTEANKDDTKRLVETINKALGDKEIPENVLKETFEVWWPHLKEKLKAVPEAEGEPEPPREPQDMLEEILNTVRGFSRQIPSISHVQEDDTSISLTIPKKLVRTRSPLGEVGRQQLRKIMSDATSKYDEEEE